MREYRALTFREQIITMQGLRESTKSATHKDHQTDQHMIYKMSQGISVSCVCQTSANVAHFSKSFLFRYTSLSLKLPQSKGRVEEKSKAAKSLLQKPKPEKQTSTHAMQPGHFQTLHSRYDNVYVCLFLSAPWTLI